MNSTNTPRPVDALREALEPFIKFANLSSFDRLPDELPMTRGSDMGAKQITAGDFKRLRDVALSASLQGEASVGVKPLEWGLSNVANRWTAIHPFGEYIVVRDHRASQSTSHGWFNNGQWIWVLSLEAAKAAAQADYEARIRSALYAAPPPPPAPDVASDPICRMCASQQEGPVPYDCTCGKYPPPAPDGLVSDALEAARTRWMEVADKRGSWSDALTSAIRAYAALVPRPEDALDPKALEAAATRWGDYISPSDDPWQVALDNANEIIRAYLEAAALAPLAGREGATEWAVERWLAEVKNRPVQNVHRRSLDDTWRQVIRHFGGDARTLLPLPPHDELVEASPVRTA